jgi:hypothetical protein
MSRNFDYPQLTARPMFRLSLKQAYPTTTVFAQIAHVRIIKHNVNADDTQLATLRTHSKCSNQ